MTATPGALAPGTYKMAPSPSDSADRISRLLGIGIPGYSGDRGPATNASVLYPFGVAADVQGNVYISDLNQAVRILTPTAQ